MITNSRPTLVQLAVTAETSLRTRLFAKATACGAGGAACRWTSGGVCEGSELRGPFGLTCKGLPPDIINFQHDPLACAIALGWNDGVEIREIPLSTEIKDGWLRHSVDEHGKRTRVVTKIDGEKFSEFWLDIMTREARATPH